MYMTYKYVLYNQLAKYSVNLGLSTYCIVRKVRHIQPQYSIPLTMSMPAAGSVPLVSAKVHRSTSTPRADMMLRP